MDTKAEDRGLTLEEKVDAILASQRRVEQMVANVIAGIESSPLGGMLGGMLNENPTREGITLPTLDHIP